MTTSSTSPDEQGPQEEEDTLARVRKHLDEQKELENFFDIDDDAPPPKGAHDRLPDQMLSLMNNIHVRLAGWTKDGTCSLEQYESDVRAFCQLEAEETQWLRDLDPSQKRLQNKDANGLTVSQHNALRHFEQFGGHACTLQRETIDYIRNNGAILLLELDVREDVQVLLGTITALRSAPYTRAQEGDDNHLHPITPNFDLRDLGIPDPAKEAAYKGAEKRIVIWRTTTREKLSKQVLGIDTSEPTDMISFRRTGGGSLLKDILFRVATEYGKENLTFNIGTVFNSEDPEAADSLVLASNEPSKAHNHWMKEWAWRQRYHDTIASDPAVYMLWKAYTGSMKDGLHAFEGSNGILKGKGILDLPELDLQQIAVQIQSQIEDESRIRNEKESWELKQ